MKNNFDLKKFLVENKLTTNSRQLGENEELPVPDMNNPEELEEALTEFNEIISDNFAEGNARHSIYNGVDSVANILSNYYGPEHRDFIVYAIENSISNDEDEENVLKAAFNKVADTNFTFDLSGIDFDKEEDKDWPESDPNFQLGYKYFLKYRDELEEKGLLEFDPANIKKVENIASKIEDKVKARGELKSKYNVFVFGFMKDLWL